MKTLNYFKTLSAAILVAASAWAQTDWSQTADVNWYIQNNLETEFTITTPAQLAGLAQLVNIGADMSGKTFTLGNNIALNPANSNSVSWTPIGTLAKGFKGTFNGAGFVVSGVYINKPDIDDESNSYLGLFGHVASPAEIKNLKVADSYVKGYSVIGGLVAYNDGATITNCYAKANVEGTGDIINGGVGGLVGRNIGGTITNSYAEGNATGFQDVGGLVGFNKSAAITNSYAAGNVEGTTEVGGLVGYNETSDITGSYAEGNVKGTDNVGGLAGHEFNNCKITNSYASGKVTGNDNVGGLVGNKYTGGSITASYAIGNVSGNDNVGGLIGANYGSSASNAATITESYASGDVNGNNYVGGFAGNGIGKIEKCYAIGKVTGIMYVGGLAGGNYNLINECYATGNVTGSYAGGLVGENDFGKITNSYAFGNVTGPDIVGGLAGLNASDKTASVGVTISNCYSIGNVSVTSSNGFVGGLVGVNDAAAGAITNSFYDTEKSGQSDAGKGVGKTTAQMKEQATYSTWNFSTVWTISASANDGYPYLRNIFVAVKSIANVVSDLEYVGSGALMQIPLNATILPSNATNRNIVWTLVDGSATIVNDKILIVSSLGAFKVKAKIVDGLGGGNDYEQIFTINIGDGSGTNVFVQYNGAMMQIPLKTTTNAPSDKNIVWELLEGSAMILENSDVLIVSSLGAFKVKATIIDGLGEGFDYDKIYIINVVEEIVSIKKDVKKSDGYYGIKFANTIVFDSDKVEIIRVDLPPKSGKVVETKITIYDMLGNVVFRKSVNYNDLPMFSWDLRNDRTGRIVAVGSYLVIADVKVQGERVYRYSAKFGVKKR